MRFPGGDDTWNMIFGGRLESCDLCDLAGNLSVHHAMQYYLLHFTVSIVIVSTMAAAAILPLSVLHSTDPFLLRHQIENAPNDRSIPRVLAT